MDKKYTYKHSISEDSEATLEVKVTPELFEEEKGHVYGKLAGKVNLKGFRPGKAPKNVIEAQLGPTLYEETLNHMLPHIVAEIVNENKLRPLTSVEYKVDKFDPKEGVEFSAKFAVYPTIKLGNFGDIKLKKDKAEVTDEDIQKIVENMLEETKKKDKSEESEKHKDEDKENNGKVIADDKWVESLNMDNIKTLAQLKEEIKKTVTKQREMMNEDKYNSEILLEAVKLTGIKVPQRVINSELDAREHNYTHRIENLGLKIDDFLRNQKTTMEDLRNTWKKEVEEKLAVELLLWQIAEENDLKVSAEDIEKEINNLEDEKLKQEYSNQQGRINVGSIILRQRAFTWLKGKVEGK